MTYRASVRLLSPKVCLSLQLYDSSAYASSGSVPLLEAPGEMAARFMWI